MTLERLVQIKVGEGSITLARVGAISGFHFIGPEGICFLRSDHPAHSRDGNFCDAEGYTYTPCKLDKDSLTYKMNRELIEESIALLKQKQYSEKEEARRRIQEEESNIKSHQEHFGITSTSFSY